MKKGFTLLELIVVIIVLGILATLGLTQYGRTVERSRGSEARNILGTLRTLAASIYMEQGTGTGLTVDMVGIGTALDQSPSACRSSHYFSYGIAAAATTPTFTATRCAAGGKTPNDPGARTLTLASDLSSGLDTWGGTGAY